MTKEDIVRMAEECGIPEFENNESQAKNIMRFAALVASVEREACANAMAKIVMIPTYTHGALVKLSDVVNAIRARGQA